MAHGQPGLAAADDHRLDPFTAHVGSPSRIASSDEAHDALGAAASLGETLTFALRRPSFMLKAVLQSSG
jgi:hypothetical protein